MTVRFGGYPPEWDGWDEDGKDWLDSRAFYEMMQAYRHDPVGAGDFFDAIKDEIRKHFHAR